MSDDATPRLSLPYLAAGQAQKHVTLNEALSLLDGLVQTAVESRAVSAQPGGPSDGALYIMTASPTGADWAGRPEGAVMRFEAGAWAAMVVNEGCVAWIKDEAIALAWDGGDWVLLTSPPDELQNLDLVGVNTTADATNKLAVASDAVLFNHDGADSQVKVNKAAAGDTASHLFQTGFSGRAEFGLTGSDDFQIKVSPDGSAWHEVMSVDRATGRAEFALSALRQTQVDVFTSSGTYTVPDWARLLFVCCIGAGGGGAAGSSGPGSGSIAGGGGAGAGGRAEAWFDIADVASSLAVTVGAGGTGGAGVTGTNTGANGGVGGASSVSSGGNLILQATGGVFGFGDRTGGWGGRGDNFFSNPGGAGGLGNSGLSGMPVNTAGPFTCDLSAPGGGGGGAGLPTSDVSDFGHNGGFGYYKGRSATGGGYSFAGGNAGADKAWARGSGGGGGGGGSSATTNGGTGGAGGLPGGGGGGGGGCRNTHTSGAGGAGGRGEVIIIACG